MTPGDPAFRCAGASLLRDEPVSGTATHVRGFLLLEHTGPWGNTALLDARLPEGLGTRLRDLGREARAKVLLVRREGARRDPARLHVFAAHTHPTRPRLEAGTVADLREVLDLDLAALRTGGPTGLPARDGTLFCVCTNGRHDACCAERGRPVASALTRAHPDETWEVSHIGGDRFAANLLVLPHGHYYGRLDPPSAVSVAGTHLAGHLDLDHLRGTSVAAMPVQQAEIGLRRELGETRWDALRLVARSVDRGLTRARFAVAGATYEVVVRSAAGSPELLTCKARGPNPVPRHDVVGITRVDDSDPG